MEWKETARWIKFEEDVEEGGDKWSKPHVATLSLHSLFELRSCIFRGTVLLDIAEDNLATISGGGWGGVCMWGCGFPFSIVFLALGNLKLFVWSGWGR